LPIGKGFASFGMNAQGKYIFKLDTKSDWGKASLPSIDQLKLDSYLTDEEIDEYDDILGCLYPYVTGWPVI
jgi:hypothetical protein